MATDGLTRLIVVITSYGILMLNHYVVQLKYNIVCQLYFNKNNQNIKIITTPNIALSNYFITRD